MTIALVEPMLMQGKTIEKIASCWHGSANSWAFLFTDGTVAMLTESGESGFYYEGRDVINVGPGEIMKSLGGLAVDLGLTTQAEYDDYKRLNDVRRRKEAEESERRLYLELKAKFEPDTLQTDSRRRQGGKSC